MSYKARIETTQHTSFITTRLRCSEMWFINNNPLKEAILGYLARYTNRYNVKLYAFGLQGNHTHLEADFPELNRGSFMRDVNSTTARAIDRYVPTYTGGRPFERRYSQEFIPREEDVLGRFFYVVLQPVKDGLVEHIKDFPGYNCFEDAITGKETEYPVVDWSRYNAKRKKSPNKVINIADYTEWVPLKYERLPGFEDWEQQKYEAFMREQLEVHRLLFIEDREKKGKKGFLGVDKLLAQIPGTRPITTKKSTRTTHRPISLSACPKARKECDKWQFDLRDQHKEASKRYRKGDISVEFPPGMYKPYCRTVMAAA